MAACDLCGSAGNASEMSQLRDCYQTAGVVDICPTCDKWANKELNRIRDRIAPLMREAIRGRVAKRPTKWWDLLRL